MHSRHRIRPRSNHGFGFALLTLLLMVSLPMVAQAIPYTASSSGNFGNPLNWIPTGVPGVGDTATIPASITIQFSGTIEVDAVTIQNGGELVGNAWSNTLLTTTLNVANGGVMRGFDAMSGSGGTLHIMAQVAGNMTVQNDGVMRGGNPGGFLFFSDAGSDASCSLNSFILSNGGQFLGGANNGGVYMVSGTIDLFDAVVEGGSGFVPFNFSGQSVAGSVYISGHTIVLDGVTPGLTRVVSGTNLNLGGTGGSVAIMARACSFPSSLFIGPTAFVDVGTPTSGGCPNVRLFSAGTSTILGTVGTTGTGCAYWDPPDLILSGDGRVTAKNVTIAGDTFKATGLTGGGLQASQYLNVYLSPGGVLDLQGLTPGTPYFRAGKGITLCADEIALEPGVDLAELMDPAPVLCPGHRMPVLSVPSAVSHTVAPGDTFTLTLEVMNIGNFAGLAKVHLADSAGWLVGGPQSQTQTLAPGETILLTATISVPETPDTEFTELELGGQITGQSAQVETSVFTLK